MRKRTNEIFGTLLRFLLLTLLLTLLFLGGMLAAASIDDERVRPNIILSEQLIGEDAERMAPSELFKRDRYTDALIVGLPAVKDTCGVLHKVLLVPDKETDRPAWEVFGDYYRTDDCLKDYTLQPHNLYGRYWHGYMTVIKPLLCHFNYYHLRMINYFLLFSLLFITICLINRKLTWPLGMVFLGSFMLVGFTFIPECLQFVPCFYIALAVTLLSLSVPATLLSRKNCVYLFYTVGALTCFFDFLTTPIITLGIPMAVILLLRREDMRNSSVLFYSLSWAMGYVILWGMKWVLVAILTDYDIFRDALEAVVCRTGAPDAGFNAWIDHSLYFKAGALLLLILVGYVLCLVKGSRITAVARRYSPLLAVALLPFVWVCLTRQHTINHTYFVWRIAVVTFFALGVYYYNIFKSLNRRPDIESCKK